MKIAAIGDVHGRTNWKEIVKKDNFDKIVFIGDYFDSFNIKGLDQIKNFMEILEYKKSNKHKVVLLIGNHDFHYLECAQEQYSGFQSGMQYHIRSILQEEIYTNMQMCCIQDGVMYTHAGVTKTWLKNCGFTWEDSIDIFINDVFKCMPRMFRFTSGKNYSKYGDDICQSPTWVRPNSLIIDKLDGIKQVVGHTEQYNLKINKDLCFIDCQEHSKEFLVVNNGKFETWTTE